ncbi:hypothetical protein SEA_MAGRITTE_161 [Microbacterium phage Magritte]|nr:hypothetical protein SEA_MAGRITTE_161 [Microbacterium phage Magritte]
MSAFEFDTAYSAITGAQHLGENIPDVHLDPHTDVYVSGLGTWTALTGYTQQQSYRGAVMHPSETADDDVIREWVREAGGDLFALVEVRDEDGSYPDGDAIGWAIVYRVAA